MKLGITNPALNSNVAIAPLMSDEDLLMQSFEQAQAMHDLDMERAEIRVTLESLSRLGSALETIRKYGVTDSLTSLVGQELFNIAPSMMYTDKSGVEQEVQAAYEGVLDSIKDKIANFKVRFKDKLKGAFTSIISLQDQIIQETRRVEQYNFEDADLDMLLKKKIVANSFSTLKPTVNVITAIMTTPLNEIKPTDNSFRDNKEAMIKHGNSFKMSKNRDILMDFDPIRVRYINKRTSKRSLMTLKAAGITSIQDIIAHGKTLSDFTMDLVWDNYYAVESSLLEQLQEFPVSKLGEAESLYWWYFEVVYSAFQSSHTKLNDYLLMTLGALKAVK